MPTLASFDVKIGARTDEFSRKLKGVQSELLAFQRLADRDFARKIRDSFRQIEKDMDRIQRQASKGIHTKINLDKSSLAAMRKQIQQEIEVPVRVKYVGGSQDQRHPGGSRWGGMLADATNSPLVGAAVNVGGRLPMSGKIVLGGALGAGAIGVGIPIVSAISGARNDHLLNVAGIKADASSMEKMELKKLVLQQAGSTTKSIGDITQLVDFMSGAGFSIKEILGMVPGIVAASEATQDDLGMTGEALSGLMRTFKMKPGQSMQLADLLTQAGNLSNFNMESAWFLNKYAGGAATSMGIPIKDMLAAQMTLENLGLNKESAARYLGGGIQALATKGDKLKQAGINIFDDKGNFLGLGNAIQQLNQKTAGMSDKEKTKFFKDIFGAEAGRAMQRLAENPQMYNQMFAGLTDSAGSAQAKMAQVVNDLFGDWEKFKGELQTLGANIFTENEKWMRNAIQQGTQFIEKINDLFELKNLTPKELKQLPDELQRLANEIKGEEWYTILARGIFGDGSMPHEMAKAIQRGDWTTVKDATTTMIGDVLLAAVQSLPYETIGKIMGENFFGVLGGLFSGLSEGFQKFFEGVGLPSWMSQLLGWGAAALVMLPKLIGLVEGAGKVFKKLASAVTAPIDKIKSLKAAIDKIPSKKVVRIVCEKLGCDCGGDDDKKGPRGGSGGGSSKAKGGKGGKLKSLAAGAGAFLSGEAVSAGVGAGAVGSLVVGVGGNTGKVIQDYWQKHMPVVLKENTKLVDELNKKLNMPTFKPTNLTDVQKKALAAHLKSDDLNNSINKPGNKKTNLPTVASHAANAKSKSDAANSSLAKKISKGTNLGDVAKKADSVKGKSDSMNSSLGKTITKTVNFVANLVGKAWDWVGKKTGLWHSGGVIPKHHSGAIVQGAGSKLVNLWGGEMVLTQPQQKWLFELIRHSRKPQRNQEQQHRPMSYKINERPMVVINQTFNGSHNETVREATAGIERSFFTYGITS
jgi:TP901 family phage tail tape measure protein